jgi:hypothetical protein
MADATSDATTAPVPQDPGESGHDSASTSHGDGLDETTAAAVELETTSTAQGTADHDDAESDAAAEDESGADDGSSTSGVVEPPTCEEHQAICAGECKNIEKDKHFCGVLCVDCTVRFGNHAKCEAGRCVPEDSKRD